MFFSFLIFLNFRPRSDDEVWRSCVPPRSAAPGWQGDPPGPGLQMETLKSHEVSEPIWTVFTVKSQDTHGLSFDGKVKAPWRVLKCCTLGRLSIKEPLFLKLACYVVCSVWFIWFCHLCWNQRESCTIGPLSGRTRNPWTPVVPVSRGSTHEHGENVARTSLW